MWIYDELGYPSGAAGGLVLQENPAFEALELAFDASLDEPFLVRASYEFTHANNNYHASRRYINLLDAEAVACFVRNTHDAYWKHLEQYFGNPIVAMFTDEPSLLGCLTRSDSRERAPEREGGRSARSQRQAAACRALVPGLGGRVPRPVW